jgi:hypothetical protein
MSGRAERRGDRLLGTPSRPSAIPQPCSDAAGQGIQARCALTVDMFDLDAGVQRESDDLLGVVGLLAQEGRGECQQPDLSFSRRMFDRDLAQTTGLARTGSPS